MSQTEVYDAICDAMNDLCNWDVERFYYWIDELYDGDDEVWNNWNENTLSLIEKDVMYAFGDLMDEGRAELIGK